MRLLNDYNYIIVGAGSAGCVLANKLSEDKLSSVLLLEAGPMDWNPMIHVPAGVYYAYRNTNLNWNYQSEKEPYLLNRQISAPRGKVIGGSSSINSMVYMRGHPFDYDRWSTELDLPLWDFAQCLPYFKAGETSDRGADEWRGGDGPLSVSKGAFVNPLYDAFLEAGRESGQGSSDDLNGYKPEGVSRFDSTKRNGRRCSAAVAYLHPVLGRDNLTVLEKAFVQLVVFEDGRAAGIKFKHRGKTQIIRAKNEVILAGGAINSPQILMVSGIGPADHLREHDIKCIVNLPGVGRNLQDHATVIMKWACKRPVSIHKFSSPFWQAVSGLQWLINRTGVASSNIWEAGGLIRSNTQVAYPNIQYHFGPVGAEESGGRLKLNQAFSIHIDQLRPHSRGYIALKSSDAATKPALHFNYLSEECDLNELAEGVLKARELVGQPAFNEYRGEELVPGPDVKTESDIKKVISQYVGTDYHPCGTCRMGNNAESVVDSQFCVHGVSGLRVVDASVIPNIISGNLNAPVQMMAARAADFILNRPQLRPVRARFHFQGNHD